METERPKEETGEERNFWKEETVEATDPRRRAANRAEAKIPRPLLALQPHIVSCVPLWTTSQIAATRRTIDVEFETTIARRRHDNAYKITRRLQATRFLKIRDVSRSSRVGLANSARDFFRLRFRRRRGLSVLISRVESSN